MSYKINVGDPMPNFTIKDMDGYDLSTDDLIGSPLVIYFYPKDSTPGCTQEACSFRDNMEKFDALDTLVIGVSTDTSDSHDCFMKKHSLNYTLLPDVNKELCKKFDVLHGMLGLPERTTFVIDAEGVIRWIERPVSLSGHIERVIRAVQSLSEIPQS